MMLSAITRARIGTSDAAKRMGAAAQREAAQREAAQREAAQREAAQREAGETWAARQIEAWARRQPHVVVPKIKARWRSIVQEVAEAHGLTVAELLQDSRKPRFTHPRQEAMYRILVETPLSMPEIGRRLGGFDHTTVLHGVRAHAARNGLPVPRQDGECAS